MKNTYRLLVALTAAAMLLSSCAKQSHLSSDDTLPEETTFVEETTAKETEHDNK